ncbi:MSCRAMM family adhesin SdrC [Mycolicibacterium chlorophenolicum]|uniref:Uncharacterized protein n=1 Tax=Mycolicibacterium chlorophenolicum TaxID=37916 RepID=A0A0J6VA66_9MYCO|nr:MSCRAMM family adhesin SdrC [Mycolicibacterium chlorophenolicum]KMO67790.1 hypothetical protein MCHLDSM_07043 [Mycolicibacterium chlorophenolicum]
MNGKPVGHRMSRSGSPNREFWAAKDLLDDARPAASRRHARPTSPSYAAHIGRVGALAVSLGIGLAVAHSATGVAAAESDTDTTSATSPAKTTDTGPSTGSARDAKADDTGSSGSSTDTDTRNDSDDHADADEPSGSDEPSDDPSGGESAEDPSDEAPSGEAVKKRFPRLHTRSAVVEAETPSADEEAATGADETAATDATPIEVGTVADAPAAPPTPSRWAARKTVTMSVAESAPAPTEPVAEKSATVNVVGAVVSNFIAPLVDPAAPVSSPVTDAVLAYVRRLISHTFFNKTPVVHSVTTSQILTGQVLITIDAEDPNGDPLTYDIVQPDSGLVFRDPITGTFVYTPTVPVVGDSVPVEFQVVIRDDSEDLGFLRVLHSVARLFGLAQPDNYTQTVSFVVDPIVQLPPSVIAVGNLLPYTLGGDPIPLLSVAEILDPDSDSLKSAVVKINTGRQDGDTLTYVKPQGIDIDGVWNGVDTLTLTGLASKADYETALKAITFSATDLGLAVRGVGITLTDEQDVSGILATPALVTVVPGIVVKLPPTVLAVGGLTPFTLGGNPVKLLSVAEITDLDSGSMKGATVKITAGLKTGDTLDYVAPQGITITGSWDGTDTLTLSGVASKADYEAALKAITFSATDLGLASRIVTVSLTDTDDVTGPGTPATLLVLPPVVIELPLTVTALGAPVYTLGKPPVKVVSSVDIANADDDQLTGAVVTIAALARLSGDKLTYTGPAGTIDVVQTNAYTLTLSGTASVADYEAALKQIAFSATQLGLTRTVTITVTEADGDTNPIPGAVLVNTLTPLPPSVTVLSLPPTYTIGKTGVKLAPTVTIGDLDSDVLSGATVKITLGRQSGDTLSFATLDGIPISGTWNGTDTLTLTGTASKADYEAALESVTFTATTLGLLGRTVSIDVVDDSNLGALVPGTVLVAVKNPDRPLIATVGATVVKVNNTVKPITLATITDTDSSVLTGATVTITANRKTGDTLAYTPIAGNPITAVYTVGTGELKLSGTATIAQYKQALEAVTFKATQVGGLLPVIRTITVNVTDDSSLDAAIAGIVLTTVSAI